jgi:hypothetical protein
VQPALQRNILTTPKDAVLYRTGNQSDTGEKTGFSDHDAVLRRIAHVHNLCCFNCLVGQAGLEPATTASKVRCSTN